MEILGKLSALKKYSIAVLVLSLIVYSHMIYMKITPLDFEFHVKHLQNYIASNTFPAYPLYFICIYVLSLFSSSMELLLFSSAVVVSAATMIKFVLSYRIMGMLVGQANEEQHISIFDRSITLKNLLLLLSFALILMMPVFTGSDKFYLGKIAANNWHNSTSIFAMPFVLLLFYNSYLFLEKGDLKLLTTILILSILNILAKPSFFLVFAVVFPIFSLIRFKFSTTFFQSIIPVFISGILLLFQYYLMYHQNTEALNGGTTAQGLAIKPFHTWSFFSANIPLDLLASVLFPLVFFACYYQKLVNDLLFKYASTLFYVALLLFILVAENGVGEFHGNFGWQGMMCMYVLFLVCIAKLVSFIKEQGKLSTKDYLILAVMAIHFLAGVVYLYRIVFKNYYY